MICDYTVKKLFISVIILTVALLICNLTFILDSEPSGSESSMNVKYNYPLAIEQPPLKQPEVQSEPVFEPEIEPDPAPKTITLGTFKITAYCPCKKCCGKTPDHPAYGITSTGTKATQGRTIAVDPKVIPYGTKVCFEGPDGVIACYIAEDCGGAIKTNRIDLYFDSHQDALVWGVQMREVFIMEE